MFTVAALYHFTALEELESLRASLLQTAKAGGLKGTLLLASEGINGTVAGPTEGVERLVKALRALPGCDQLEVKYSTATDMPFLRLKVKIKPEIVTLGQPCVDPTAQVGTYVPPAQWNALIARDDVVVIDTRNDYEVAIGQFEGAVDPQTQSFSDFPKWWADNAKRFEGKSVAMYCTGGIRCEKSTNYLMGQGVEEVFHLKGGILKYLEEVPEAQSLWRGDCFVFDGRVSVSHGLREGPHELCYACRRPILAKHKQSPEFEHGVSCPFCFHETTPAKKARFRERQKQVALAEARGTAHIGEPQS